MTGPKWWRSPWLNDGADPDTPASQGDPPSEFWVRRVPRETSSEESLLTRLESEFGQVRSRERVRSLAEVFTHQREVDAMLDLIPDAFAALDITFLEPACGSGNFLVEILRRKLALVETSACASQEQYEHRLLRGLASIYGVDVAGENVVEARGRMAHLVLERYEIDANTVEPTPGFLSAATAILKANIIYGDTLGQAQDLEVCEWRPHSGGRFQRIWSYSLVMPDERDLFWVERVQDREPVHYSQLSYANDTRSAMSGELE